METLLKGFWLGIVLAALMVNTWSYSHVNSGDSNREIVLSGSLQ